MKQYPTFSRGIQKASTLSVKDDRGFIGMFHAAIAEKDRLSLETIWQRFVPLSEDNLIGADASVLDFILDADERPCRFVIARTNIVGLVSLSDLQRLPVRAALFALITGFEITMSKFIEQAYPDDEGWLCLLTKTRREKIKGEKTKSEAANGYVGSLLFTQFCDKQEIVRLQFPEDRRKSLEETLNKIERLRNSVAHANDYASSPIQAAA